MSFELYQPEVYVTSHAGIDVKGEELGGRPLSSPNIWADTPQPKQMRNKL